MTSVVFQDVTLIAGVRGDEWSIPPGRADRCGRQVHGQVPGPERNLRHFNPREAPGARLAGNLPPVNVVYELRQVIARGLGADPARKRSVVIGVIPGNRRVCSADPPELVVDSSPEVGVDVPAVDHAFVKSVDRLHEILAEKLEVPWRVVPNPLMRERDLCETSAVAPLGQQAYHLPRIGARDPLPHPLRYLKAGKAIGAGIQLRDDVRK